MKKSFLLLGLVCSIMGCTALNQKEQTVATKENTPSAYAKYSSGEYLKVALAMTQGDSRKPLSDDYRACVLKDYPKMNETMQAFLRTHFGQEMLDLANENYLLDISSDKANDKANREKIHANEQKLWAIGFEVKQRQLGYLFLDRDYAKANNHESTFNELHRLANARFKECASVN